MYRKPNTCDDGVVRYMSRRERTRKQERRFGFCLFGAILVAPRVERRKYVAAHESQNCAEILGLQNTQHTQTATTKPIGAKDNVTVRINQHNGERYNVCLFGAIGERARRKYRSECERRDGADRRRRHAVPGRICHIGVDDRQHDSTH
jgi:hypothetical protein